MLDVLGPAAGVPLHPQILRSIFFSGAAIAIRVMSRDFAMVERELKRFSEEKS